MPEDSLDDICTRVTELVTRTPRDVIVYCGTDWIMSGLEDRIKALNHASLQHLQLVGYDGVIENDGNLLAKRCLHALATVDTDPQAQGQAAARLLIDEYEGTRGGPQDRIIQPAVLLRPRWK